MNLEQYIERLKEMDPDAILDELGIDSVELVNKFHNRAAKHFYEEQEEYEGDDDTDV